MSKVYLLDCTLRDGGYINDWNFGEDTIRGFCQKIAKTGIEILEVGFIKGDSYDPDKSVFPDTESFKNVILPKNPNLKYVGMLDMSAPVPKERIRPCDGTSIDGIRVQAHGIAGTPIHDVGSQRAVHLHKQVLRSSSISLCQGNNR